MNALDLLTKDAALRSILSVSLFSLDMLFLVLFMSCIYGIKGLHDDFGIVWQLLFFRMLLCFIAMLTNEFSYISEFSEKRGFMQGCASMAENASLLCFVIAYRVMIGCFARLLEEVKKNEQAARCRKGAILYISLGISAVMFGVADIFVPAEGKLAIMAGILATATFVMRLIVIILDVPIYFAIRDAIGNIWRIRLEKAQEGRHIR
jgi:hypothetical protein